MKSRQWFASVFPKHREKKCFLLLPTRLLLAMMLWMQPDSIRAQEDPQQDVSDGSVFDGTYAIHLSESAKIRASGRAEPGYFDNLAIELFVKAGLKIEIIPQMPWKRQMELAERLPGQVIYPTTRIGVREDHFQWVGPVSRTFWNFYGLKSSGWPNTSFETQLRDARIGVLLGSAREAYLRERGAANLITVPREELILPMLMANRVDVIAIGGSVLRHYLAVQKVENPDLPVPVLSRSAAYRTCYLYIAISGDVPDQDITKLQTQLDLFKTNGFFVENRRQHGLSTDTESAFLKAMLDLDNNGVSCIDHSASAQ